MPRHLHSVGSSKLVILGGLAELFAGSISMGLGAYLAGITDRRHYDVELAREHRQVVRHPEQEIGIMSDLFAEYGLTDEELRPLVKKLRSNPDHWVKVGFAGQTFGQRCSDADLHVVHDAL